MVPHSDSSDRFDIPWWRSDKPNRVIQAAESLVPLRPTIDTIHAHANKLIDEGISMETVYSAAERIHLSSKPTDLVDIVAKISAYIASRCTGDSDVSQCHFCAANTLDTRMDPRSLEAAAWHYQKSREHHSRDRFLCLFNEASVRYRLSFLGVDMLRNLHRAAELIDDAHRECEPGTEESWKVRALSACISVELAFNGVHPLDSITAGIDECDSILDTAPYPSDIAGQALHAKARAMLVRGGMGLAPTDSYQEAIELCQNARDCFDRFSDPMNYSQLLGSERGARLSLADLGRAPLSNALAALKLADESESLLAGQPTLLSRVWLDRALGNRLLAEWNPDEASERLDTALSFLARVRDSFGLDDRFALSALLCEASCYYLLSKRGQSPIDNLKKALNCLTDANAWRARLHDVDVFMAVTEASVRKDLAEHGIDPADNLRKAINRCIDAGANLAATSRYRDFLLLSRAAAHARLADFGIDSINNLKAAAFLCGECDHSGPGLVPIVLKARLDAATVLQKLVYWGVEPREKLDQALSVYFELLEASSGSASENPRIRDSKHLRDYGRCGRGQNIFIRPACGAVLCPRGPRASAE